MKELDDGIDTEEQKMKGLEEEIDAIRTRIRERSETKTQLPPSSRPVVQYGSYYRMQQQQKQAAAPSEPADPSTLKRKINHMLSEYKRASVNVWIL
ncbi:hypothetical protein QTG54_011764 [Skeletonema marinoi]|uniref:Uncharacterized protein n=1 Tax=Skeletonema marinoi TaxID=267567 RepID=A0AAD8Y1J2_9STRA|nr:hypothetical protein QTG54_011764 [Skeletonema marinoi]